MNRFLRAIFRLSALAFLWCFTSSAFLNAQTYYSPYQVIRNTTFQYQLPASVAPTITHQPTHGTASIQSINGVDFLTFTPDTDFIGLDSVQVYLFIPPFNENLLGFQLEVVPSIVIARNDYEMELSPVSITEIPVLDNDSTSTGSLYLRNISVVNNGVAQISADSTVINFTPDLDYVGLTYLLYTACDENNMCDQGMLTIRMTDYVPPETDTTLLSTNMNAAIPVVLPFTGFQILNQPPHGTLEQINNFVYIYHPDNGYFGLDSFDFELTDGSTASTATVLVDVLSTPAPNEFAIQDFAYLTVNQDSLLIDVLSNDVNGQALAANSLQIASAPENGTAQVVNGKIAYFPPAGFEGVDVFTYSISNLFGVSETASVYAIVSNHYPAFFTFELTTPKNTPLVINYQVPISGFEFTIENNPPYGSLQYYPGDTTIELLGQEISGYNLLVYTPDPDFVSEDETDFDDFEIKYCVDGNCPTVKIDVFVQDISQADTFCIGDDCVWAGDTDNNGIVDIRDVLPIGLGMGEAGVSRANATLDWYGQHTSPWNAQTGSIEPQFCDTDGNGIVTHEDTAAIGNHYLKTHNLVPEETPVTKQALYFDIITPLPAQAGDLVVMEISLGAETAPLLDMYGLSMEFNFNTALINPASVDFLPYENSWLTIYSPMLAMEKRPFGNRLDIALTRTNGQTASGYGAVGQISFIIIEDLNGFRYGQDFAMNLEINSVHGMDGYGQSGRLNDLSIEVPISLSEKKVPFSADNVITFPNPASQQVNVHLNKAGDNKLSEVCLFATDGKEIMHQSEINSRTTQVDVSNLPNGIYFLHLITNEGIAVKKIQVVH